jgi:phage terminase large subunit-like protein
MVDLSVPDWFEKLKSGRPPLPNNLPLDEDEAAKAVKVFEKLRLPDVPGKPLLRDVAAPWARDFIAAIFGTVRLNEDKTIIVGRSVRKFFQLVPKKNSKTTNGAAIMLTALLRNRRPNADFLLVGPTQATAELAYDQADGMIMADPWLSKRFASRDHLKTIEDRRNGSTLRVRSFDNRVMTGVKPVAVLVDELHELGKIHYAAKVMAQIEGGIIANPEGFIVIITTQSDDAPTGVFKSELEHARAVRDGQYQDGETLAMMYEFPLELQADKRQPWLDPKLWPWVLPNLGRSITIDRLLPKFREAREKSDEAFAIWVSQHLNIQVGTAINDDSWTGALLWGDAIDRTLTLDELLARAEVVTFGGDGGGLDDLLGVSVIGREKGTRRWLVWNHAFAVRSVLGLREGIASRLLDFEKEGSLTFCAKPSEMMTKFGELFAKVLASDKLPEKDAVGLDPNNVAAMIEQLTARGMTDSMLRRLRVNPGEALSPAWWGLEMKLADGTLVHPGLELMKWVVGNAKVEPRGNGIMITKQVSGRAKIDPLIATGCATMLMSWNPEARGPSVYRERGALVL